MRSDGGVALATTQRRSLREWLGHAVALGIDRLEAEHLLAFALRCPRSLLYAHPEREPDPAAAAAFEAGLARRRRGEPLAYILGEQPFRGLPIAVTPAVLVPRADTETLIDAALACLSGRSAPSILDLGTGSGAIAVALAYERRDARIVATDLSAEALAVAAGNAGRLVPGRIDFRLGHWYQPVAAETFDLIVSNPPYLADDELARADPELGYEPALALDGGGDGLDALRAVVGGAPARLRPGGVLLVEHGAGQGEAVRELLSRARFSEVATLRDQAGRERIGRGVLTAPARTR